MSFCFLYNPSSNRKRSYNKFLLLKELTKSWPDVDYITTESRNHLKSAARKAAKHFDTVVACGGDGTVRDVAVALMDSDATLGVIPLGSGNDFSKGLGLNSGLKNAVEVLKRGKTGTVSIGRCNDFYFINTLGFGFDGQTNRYATESSLRIGSIRYALAALKANFLRTPFKVVVTFDGNLVKENDWIMITAANGRVEGGNFIIAPDATPFDAVLRLVMIRPISKWLLPLLLPFFLMGRHQWLPYYECKEVQKVSLDFNRSVFIHTDGEQINSSDTHFEIELYPEALHVICR